MTSRDAEGRPLAGALRETIPRTPRSLPRRHYRDRLDLTQRGILQCLCRRGVSRTADLLEHTGASEGQYHHRRRELISMGLMEGAGWGRWRLTEVGRRYARRHGIE